ncbi:MAG: multidrug ABC transporter permease [Rhodospirillaceae bacterium BRH_c57]|nr:MAG: multidrug ABC transporter permease [Rhodospirillaceae bacterium BRH_c57]
MSGQTTTALAPAVWALARREFVRFIRQPQRVIGSLGQPLLFWVFLGAGFTPSFNPPGMEGMTYLEYFYPGVLMMMILFASIFSTITVIEDRDQGFLQGVLVAPVPRMAIVLGKVFGGASIALFQAFILLIAAPFLDTPLPLASLPLLVAAMVLTAVGYTALGFSIAWSMRSTAGFHAIMMVFLMPLWLLSGALFPVAGAPMWLQVVMAINPVAHAMTLLRGPFYATPAELLTTPAYLTGLAVVVVWVALGLWVSAVRVGAREKGAATA